MRKFTTLLLIAVFSVTTALHATYHPPGEMAKKELVSKTEGPGQAFEIAPVVSVDLNNVTVLAPAAAVQSFSVATFDKPADRSISFIANITNGQPYQKRMLERPCNSAWQHDLSRTSEELNMASAHSFNLDALPDKVPRF